MKYRVLFTSEAEEHLDELYRYIAEAADLTVAARYVDEVIDYCKGLGQSPPVVGPETTSVRDPHGQLQEAHGHRVRDPRGRGRGPGHLSPGGRDYEAILREPDDDAM